MEGDRELLPALTHLLLTFAGREISFTPSPRLGSSARFLQWLPNSSVQIPVDVGVLSSKPDLSSSLGALLMELGAVGIPSPVEVSGH